MTSHSLVDPSLKHYEDDLNGILKSLTALGGKPVITTDEVVDYQQKLDHIDQGRKDGKFVDKNGQVPPGQGTLHTLLAECYSMVQEAVARAQRT